MVVIHSSTTFNTSTMAKPFRNNLRLVFNRYYRLVSFLLQITAKLLCLKKSLTDSWLQQKHAAHENADIDLAVCRLLYLSGHSF